MFGENVEYSSGATILVDPEGDLEARCFGKRDWSLGIPVGATNYNFGGSCEATAVDALVHANTRSIPFPFPGSSHTP